ncbi:PEP-CTERM sorting domain-containing protein [Haloferula sargassicola]|uniref:Ice-binding protein C-terminal domain-containing protein n=1 Tax=Haloferula sargassicola TaxID=490096 RepID=A0ABP9UN12_9BACT
MNRKPIVLTLGLIAGLAGTSQATVLGFGQIGGSNATVPSNYGSNAAADASGLVVTNGATPNLTLTWDAAWDIHTSHWFAGAESATVGGGDWDNEGGIPRIGQLDEGVHSIAFGADPGYALVLNSFDFGLTNETINATTSWTLTLTDGSSNVVWSQNVNFASAAAQNDDGDVQTITPNFTGNLGESYTLTFTRTAESFGSNGRHALDNLSFNQTTVPEPASAALIGLGAVGLLRRRRR